MVFVIEFIADLDLDKERDLDHELQAELAPAKQVTDDFAQIAKLTAGGCEELCEALYDSFCLPIAVIAGIGRRP